MNQSLLRSVATLAIVISGACALPTSRDPYAGAGSSQSRNRPAVRVQLEVVCDQCLISFAAGPERGSVRAAQADQVWSYRFVRYPLGSELVTLSATMGEGRLQSARIIVNGELAAIDQNDFGASRTMLCAATLIPRPSGSDEPVRGDSCGGGQSRPEEVR